MRLRRHDLGIDVRAGIDADADADADADVHVSTLVSPP
jgi:hypothetical protein